jgi:hypothetical protein
LQLATGKRGNEQKENKTQKITKENEKKERIDMDGAYGRSGSLHTRGVGFDAYFVFAYLTDRIPGHTPCAGHILRCIAFVWRLIQ